jgi:NRAMP (natural resistance-associated macrophage protein)-like metal ion transporter
VSDQNPTTSSRHEKVRRFGLRLRLLLAILGPGIITANVDNDAGGITTYSQAGARFGLATLWIFIPLCLCLIVVQEMSNRMGVVTGKGLSDLIRERFGAKVTFYLLLGLLVTNFGNILAEFAGVAAAGEIFGLPRVVIVPLAAFFVWGIVLRASYRTVEKVFLVACLFYLSYVVAGAYSHPPAREVLTALTVPHFRPEAGFAIMLVGLVGTTIAPWMQFYQQASVAEKNVRVEDYNLSRIDTVVGCIAVSIVAIFIVVVCSTHLYAHGITIETAADAARGLAPFAGRYAAWLFAFGLLNASVFAASILPLSTSYTICEGLGWESGVNKTFSEARQFYVLYTALIAVGAGFILFPGISLLGIMYLSQVVNGILLPVVLVYMLRLINDKRIMGRHTNSFLYNVVCVALAGSMTVLALGSGFLVLFER